MRFVYGAIELVPLLVSAGLLILAMCLPEATARVSCALIVALCLATAAALPLLWPMMLQNREQVVIVCILSLLCVSWIRIPALQRDLELQLPFTPETISRFHGRTRFDSSISKNGNTVIRIQIKSAATYRGDIGDASGELIGIVFGESILIPAGTDLIVEGEPILVDDGMLFSVDACTVQERNNLVTWYLDLRVRLLQGLEQRVTMLESPASTLCLALLLGRYTDDQSLREEAILSGSAHVLALSGMHLQVFAGCIVCMLRFLLKRRTAVCRILVSIFAAGYLMLIGPKPSLVRACIMICLPLVFPRFSSRMILSAVCIVHLWLTPQTFISSGAMLSYGVLAGILIVIPRIATLMALIMPRRVAMIVALSIGASLIGAPLSLTLFGSWRIIGMVTAPVLAPLAIALLFNTILYVALPLIPLEWTILVLARSFSVITEWASSWSLEHDRFNAFSVWLWTSFLLLTVLGVLQYACRIERKRSRLTYDLGFSLRFSPSYHATAHRERICHVEEVRTEFSHLSHSTKTDCRYSHVGKR